MRGKNNRGFSICIHLSAIIYQLSLQKGSYFTSIYIFNFLNFNYIHPTSKDFELSKILGVEPRNSRSLHMIWIKISNFIQPISSITSLPQTNICIETRNRYHACLVNSYVYHTCLCSKESRASK